MKDLITNCPYCGQAVMIKAEEDWKEDKILKEAIMNCNCEMARFEQNLADSINEAEMYIREEYQAPETVKELFLKVADEIGHGKIEKITISIEKTKYSMAKKTKGGIRVDKVTTTKDIKET